MSDMTDETSTPSTTSPCQFPDRESAAGRHRSRRPALVTFDLDTMFGDGEAPLDSTRRLSHGEYKSRWNGGGSSSQLLNTNLSNTRFSLSYSIINTVERNGTYATSRPCR